MGFWGVVGSGIRGAICGLVVTGGCVVYGFCVCCGCCEFVGAGTCWVSVVGVGDCVQLETVGCFWTKVLRGLVVRVLRFSVQCAGKCGMLIVLEVRLFGSV